ncbi:MAG: aldehyde dehydrogenase family protein [Actinobacteria bacterium]|nr:aldehyde dehydrogenase family protein [Actinomycetota bacterium]
MMPAVETRSTPVPQGDTLFVAGEWRAAARAGERFDPSRPERSTGLFAAAAAADVEDAYAAAVAAAPAWAATPAPARAELLRRAADCLAARAEAAALRLTADMGKAIGDARAEVRRGAAILRYFAGELEQPIGETYASADPATALSTFEQPLGVACVITPWNFPVAIPLWKLAPAIGFGNTVVWKPAEAASGSAVLLAEVLADAGLPAGVLNLITGHGSELSAALTGAERLAAITFTGSGTVGTRLRQAVADRNVKVQLELGGKNPAIVLADADLADAALQVTRGAMLATGQRCTATSRVYVERPVADEFARLLADQVGRLVVGDPFDEATQVGPLASAEQAATVAEYFALARAEGARVIAGDLAATAEGCFAVPTVIADVAPDSRVVREEVFGPLLVLFVVDDLEDALGAANETDFGLSSAIFTRDLGKAMRFVRETQTGLVHVNRETAGVEPHVPFGGVKGSSSLSREQGKAARQFFTTTKTVYLRST